MKEELRQALARRRKSRIADPTLSPAAVLVPIFQHHGEYHILLGKRTDGVQYHKGQISFPGGAYEEKDGSLLNTALRETFEEIGLAPEAVEVLGELDDAATASSHFCISPFVAIIPWPYPFKADRIETKEIISVPIAVLLDKNCLGPEVQFMEGQQVTVQAYHYEGHVIWGATARILSQLLGIWEEVVRKLR